MVEASETGIYIFCGIQTEQEDQFGEVMVEGKPYQTFTIHYKEAAIVVAEVPMKIYHPKREHLMMHQNVISAVMKKYDAVIPISFGNVMKTKDDVKALLENLYPQFEKLFPEISGKIELGLKVIGKKDWLEAEIMKNRKVGEMSQAVSGKSEAAGFYERIQLGGLAQQFFTEMQEAIKTEIFDPLASLAEAEKRNDPTSEKMLLNASFLINRSDEKKFDELVNKVHEKWKGKTDFKYSGPWPAYNFINIRLKVEGS
ncbi:MAG TPA: GvpL/GvpF family gas vesicle protein [Bacillales bacterium]|nr:GvpL/GvpF family gas vesicle protein [Bacillales bacterium]